MVLPIVKYGDPVLQMRAEEIKEIDDEIRTLAADMIETMHAGDGIGLAANQVGSLHRIAVVDPSAGKDPDAIIVLINPDIIESGGDPVEVNEGCLSFPDVHIDVVRPDAITVRALDLNGDEMHYELTGMLSRIFQHEIDHLNGVLFIDHIRGLARHMVLTRIKGMKRRGEWDI